MNLRILHTNDLHSRFENFARIVKKIKELKNESTVILDAGDFNDAMRIEVEGTKSLAGLRLLNVAGYDALVIGNNEGFQGLETLEVMGKSNLIPILSCNLFKSDMSNINCIKRSIIIERGELKMLVIGATPPYNDFFSLMNMNATSPKEEIEKEIKDNEGKYDICILLSHLGIDSDLELASNIKGIDIVIGGHSHSIIEEGKNVDGTIINQAGCYGAYLGVLDLQVENKKVVSFNQRLVDINDSIEEDKEIMNEILLQKEIANEILSRPLYNVEKDIWHDIVEENPITNLLADALKEAIPCDFSIINSGIINGGIRKGIVCNKKLLEISPSPLNPTYMEIKGKYIKEALNLSLKAEVCMKDGKGSGFRGKYLGKLHVSNAIIEHNDKEVISIKIGDKEISDDKEYRVATSDYLQRGTGYEPLKNNKNVKYNPEYTRDLLRESLRKKDSVEKCFGDRWYKCK